MDEMGKDASVKSLLSAARQGDCGSLGRVLARYADHLKFLATTQLDWRLRAKLGASDVVQEVFCQAHRDFGQFRGQEEAEFIAWLRQILAHCVAHLHQRHLWAAKRDARREIRFKGSAGSWDHATGRIDRVLVDRGHSPSSEAHRQEYIRLLFEELSGLPQDYRCVIMLRHVEGLPFDEIASRMDRSCGAVRMAWVRAIQELRRRLKAKGLE